MVDPDDEKILRAAQVLLLADKGKLTVSAAMTMCGFSLLEAMNRTRQMQVRRRLKST